MKLVYEAPAKINLFLRVTGVRDDGFHELSSLFAMIDLCDILVIETADTDVVTVISDTTEIPDGEGNLVYKAAMALKTKCNVKAGAKISLSKNIPVSAGLGGGSSDAAATLMALDKLWGVGLDRSELMAIGATIGSDVPFFFGSATTWVTGRGEKLKTVAMQKSLPLLLIKPAFGISSGDAYQGSDFTFEPTEESQKIIEDIATGSPEKVAKHLVNDLEPWAMETYPELVMLRDTIKETSPLGVLMSGSGSALLALYEDETKLAQAHDSLQGKASFVCLAKTLVAAPKGVVGK